MKLGAPLILLVLGAGLLTAAPITVTGGSIIITGNFSGTFHLISDTFDISGTLFNPNFMAIFLPLGPYVKPGDPNSPQELGNTFGPFTGSGTINGVHYDSMSFVTCSSCLGPGSFFTFDGPSAPFELPVFTAPFTVSGVLSVYTSGSAQTGDCLICGALLTGSGTETVHTQLFPNGEYGYAPPLEYDFVPEPSSVLLTGLAMAMFLLFLLPHFLSHCRFESD